MKAYVLTHAPRGEKPRISDCLGAALTCVNSLTLAQHGAVFHSDNHEEVKQVLDWEPRSPTVWTASGDGYHYRVEQYEI